MNYRIRCIAGLALAVTMSLVAAEASTSPRFDLQNLVTRSEVIVRGRCLSGRPFFDPATGIIWTRYEFEILDPIKGPAGRSLVVTEPGGVVGSVGHAVPGVPHFQPGEEGVLFLYRTELGKWRVRGARQGYFRMDGGREQSVSTLLNEVRRLVAAQNSR